MQRKKKLLMAAYHEIGHYLMLRRFQKVLNSEVLAIKIYSFRFDGTTGEVLCSVLVDNTIEDESIEFIEDLICVCLAGFIATQIIFKYSSEISAHSDRVKADYLAILLEERYQQIGISKSKQDIINEQRKSAQDYLLSKRSELEDIAKMLFKRKVLSSKRLKTIEKVYSL